MTLGKKRLARGGNPYSLDFDGINQTIDIPNNFGIFDGSHDYSLACWLKADSLDGYSYIISLRGENYTLLYNEDPGTEITYFASCSDGKYRLNTTFTTGVWGHVVYTYSTSEGMKLYMDGSLSDSNSNTASIDSRSEDNRIGDAGTNKYYWDGNIDGVKFYNRALTQNEITKLYKGVSISRTGLMGEWKMNKGSGGTAYDSSGNGHHGTLVNGPTWSTDTPTYGG